MKPRIIAAIDNVHMGLAHEGLRLCALKLKVNVEKLGAKDLVVFVNRARTKIKVLGAHGTVLGYLKSDTGQKLPLEALQWLPETFSETGQLDLAAAIQKHLKATLERKGLKGGMVGVFK